MRAVPRLVRRGLPASAVAGDALASSVLRSATELQRCVEELGFVGCLLNPDPSDGYWQSPPLTDKVYYPLYEKMVELGVPAMLHVAMSRNPAVQGTCAHYLGGDTACSCSCASRTCSPTSRR